MKINRLQLIASITGFSRVGAAIQLGGGGNGISHEDDLHDELSNGRRSLLRTAHGSTTERRTNAHNSTHAHVKKKSKSGKGGGLPYPSSPDLERIEAIYGKQLSKKEARAWTEAEDTYFHSFGLNQLVDKVSAYSVHRVNPYTSNIVTMSEAKLVCATECDRLPTCKAVSLNWLNSRNASVVTDEIVCRFIDPTMGPVPITTGSIHLSRFEPSILYKKGVDPFPEFEECNVPTLPEDASAAATCVVTELLGGPECTDELLTDDYNSYVRPAIECVANELGPDGLLACLNCLQEALYTMDCTDRVLGLCDVTSNIITGECGSACVPSSGELTAECFADIQTAVLCSSAVSHDKNGTGCIASNQAGFDELEEDYTCPESVSLVQE